MPCIRSNDIENEPGTAILSRLGFRVHGVEGLGFTYIYIGFKDLGFIGFIGVIGFRV